MAKVVTLLATAPSVHFPVVAALVHVERRTQDNATAQVAFAPDPLRAEYKAAVDLSGRRQPCIIQQGGQPLYSGSSKSITQKVENNTILPVYIINLKKRPDRKTHIMKEFAGRSEFGVTIIEACEHSNGAIGLWKSVIEIVKIAEQKEYEFVIICEDDHEFTEAYSNEKLLQHIRHAKALNADILIAGLSWFNDALQINDNLFWARIFSGTQFIVVFRHFFTSLLSAGFEQADTLDFKVSEITNNKLFIHPYMSIQKDFGYSDATEGNNSERRLENLFIQSSFNLDVLKKVTLFYKSTQKDIHDMRPEQDFEKVAVSTYIINLPERTERRRHIKEQFEGRDEFAVCFIEACKHQVGAVGLWLSIRKVIELAIQNEDEVIIICEDDHEFTPDYNKTFLMENIIEGRSMGADYISGGTGSFECAVPVTKNLYWVYSCSSSQFIILFREMFVRILEMQFDESIIADVAISGMSSNKMVIYPFISAQKDFGYSDITSLHNERTGIVQSMFKNTSARLELINKSIIKYGICY